MTATAPISAAAVAFSVTVNRDELAKELSLCATACAKRPTIAILAYVLLETDHDSLSLRATDLELTVYAKLPASIGDGGGAITIELSTLLAFAKNAPDEKISITYADGFVLLQSGTAKHKLPTLPAEGYPSDIRSDAGTDTERAMATVPLGVLKTLLTSTQYAMTEHETQFQVNGCVLATTKRALESVATDGHRLAFASYPDAEVANEATVLLPKVGVSAVARMIDADDASVAIYASENHLIIECGTSVLCVRKQDVNFPDYRAIMEQQKFQQRAELEVASLKSAVNRTMAAANNDRAVALTFSTGRLKLSAADASTSRSAEEQIPAEYAGPETLVGMSGKYIVDTLSALGDVRVGVQFTDADKPMLVIPAIDTDGDDSIEQWHLLMPMRLKGKL